MPKYPLTYRLARVLRFLVALRDPGVSARLAQRGFDVEEAERGWALFDRAAGRSLAMRFPAELPEMSLGELLDLVGAWYRRAYDVADATLRHEAPALHAQVCNELSKSRGAQGLLHARLLIQRLQALEASEEPAACRAWQLLSKRGLGPDGLAEGAALLAAEARVGPAETPEGFGEAEDQRLRDEAELWAWYQSWSQIARTVVDSKRLRIRMGISQMGRSADDEGDPE